MNSIKIKRKSKSLDGTITLPSSKSESNRLLIIKALTEDPFLIENLSTSDDTQILKKILDKNKNGETNFDVGPAGTTMRFLAAYFSTLEGERVLTGSDRMKRRPIKILVDSLKTLGAKIKYLESEGFPPISIEGTSNLSDYIEIDSSISSQYISALLLIAPTLPDGLTIKILNQGVSQSYIDMTLHILKKYGIKYEYENSEIKIKYQKYKAVDYQVDADWSAASYWYSISALSRNSNLRINRLSQHSVQGDRITANIFKWFGVKTEFLGKDVILKKHPGFVTNSFDFDFSNCPDIAQTVAITMAGLKITGKLSGLSTLAIKETDRIDALCKELSKIGVVVNSGSDFIQLKKFNNPKNTSFYTYDDHRMAMSLAPLACIFPSIILNDYDVVSKSYPDFYKHLSDNGFSIINAS